MRAQSLGVDSLPQSWSWPEDKSPAVYRLLRIAEDGSSAGHPRNRRVQFRSTMATAQEFTVTIEDKPGALGKCCLALAERGVNILAFQSYVEEGESLARFIVDDPYTAQTVFGNLRMIFERTVVAVVRLPNRPGEFGRAAARLGEAKINIDYSYCGLEPHGTQGMLVFGVDDLKKASAALDELVGK